MKRLFCDYGLGVQVDCGDRARTIPRFPFASAPGTEEVAVTHDEETRNFLGDPPNQDPEYFPDDDEHYEGSGERYCWDCGGRGWKITCPDDLCHGQDECIHGDPPTRCWTCNKDGELEDWL